MGWGGEGGPSSAAPYIHEDLGFKAKVSESIQNCSNSIQSDSRTASANRTQRECQQAIL